LKTTLWQSIGNTSVAALQPRLLGLPRKHTFRGLLTHLLTLVLFIKQETLVEMKGQGKSVTADWVGRRLYWLEEFGNRRQMNVIMKHDLQRHADTPTGVVLQRPSSVKFGSIQVDPRRR